LKHTRLIVILLFAAMFLLLSFLVSNATASAAMVSTAVQPTIPTTIDNHAAIFALLVILFCLTVGMLTRRPSIRASIQRQRDEWARNGGAPEHAWVDTSASFGANVVCFLWCAVGAYLAVAILFGNLFWLLVILAALGIIH